MNRRSNKLWVDQEKEFYNSLIQIWLDDNNISMHSTHDEGKSVVVERVIKTLKIKIYKKLQIIKVNLILLIQIN